MRISLQQIETFLLVARLGGFHAAARHPASHSAHHLGAHPEFEETPWRCGQERSSVAGVASERPPSSGAGDALAIAERKCSSSPTISNGPASVPTHAGAVAAWRERIHRSGRFWRTCSRI